MQITQRAIALLVVVGLLVISFVGSTRIYLDQQSDMATARTQIAEQQATIAQLQDELSRWNDPSYIKTQARERLGWVMPGEVGYRVIGTDGTVVSGEVGSIRATTTPRTRPGTNGSGHPYRPPTSRWSSHRPLRRSRP